MSIVEVGFGYVIVLDVDLAALSFQDNLKEDFLFMKVSHHFIYSRDMILFIDGELIQYLVVDANTQGDILFLLENKRCSPWR